MNGVLVAEVVSAVALTVAVISLVISVRLWKKRPIPPYWDHKKRRVIRTEERHE